MAQKFKLPDLGEGIQEAEIQEILVSAGDTVAEDDLILLVETDKATVEIPSPYSGKVQTVHVAAGDLIQVGTTLLTFDNDLEAAASKAESDETEADNSNSPQTAAAETKKEQPPKHEASLPVPAAPATRRLARELEIDIHQVEGSGPGGRVTRQDVQTFAEHGDTASARANGEPKTASPEPVQQPFPTVPELPDFARWGEVERVPLRSVRRATARRMSQSWRQIPHVTHQDKADITDLEQLRQHYSQQLNLENLTLTAFIMKTVVAVLKEFPRFNASLDSDNDEIVLKHYYHLGVAVDTERGLIVPVIPDVDSKSIAMLARELAETVEQTRKGEIDLATLQGGTFTITNIGPLGGTAFTPIINFPQAAILGLGQATWAPVVQTNGNSDPQQMTIQPRYMLPVMLTFDHRLADGAEAARFCRRLIGMLEDPNELMLLIS
ncbi:MAG: 2-oxo acid dehydrogenase subunit E2 [Anaerolineales bacterium]|nr:2-oxo acid dehydrogenase subunit E2 [Anaerolineales bacterium]